MSTPPPVSLYDEALAAAGTQGFGHARPPRSSAAVVPWRRGERGIEVFWVRRSPVAAFMPGWHAFPGGGLAKTDADLPVVGEVQRPSWDRSALPEALRAGDLGPDLVPGLVAAALRELIEENHLVVVDRPLADQEMASLIAAADIGLLAAELTRLGVSFDASRLTFAGRWLTPPFAPIRFDNRFFLLEWPETERYQPHVPAGGELAEGEWIQPADALAQWTSGHSLMAPPIQHLLTVLASDGPEAGLGRLWEPLEADLGPTRRIEFRPGVVLFPLATATLPPASTTNCYLLGTGPRCVVVDPGSPFPLENQDLELALAAAAEKLGRRVSAIWLTHHHPDHVGGVERLRQTLGVPVLAHAATRERLAGLGIAVDGLLDEGDEVDLGGPGSPFLVRVLHTPGHARGHLSFWLEHDRTLLCGDLMSAISTIVIDPPEGDMASYLDSLRRVADLEPRTLLPGHGPAVLDGANRLRALIEHRLERGGKIRDAFLAGYHELADIFPLAYAGEEIPPALRPLAHRQIRAHLEYLADRGELVLGR